MPRGSAATLECPHQDVMIHAAGGMVVRRGPDGVVQVAVVYRPARGDWTFPKGKLEPDETLEECARREVYEETGFNCRLGTFVGHTEYRDRKDRPKVVAYWVMDVESGLFHPNVEVEELRWVDLAAAARTLSYDRDRELLVALSAAADDLFGIADDDPGIQAS